MLWLGVSPSQASPPPAGWVSGARPSPKLQKIGLSYPAHLPGTQGPRTEPCLSFTDSGSGSTITPTSH